ncbi:MAG: hypothetical protein M3292_04560 [Actinomycetota bacterium]|nr:hypothetical protein [Actinomycetota bacterium]
MKLILSRKGFDATTGGGASPILPDGRMVSIPIPGAPERDSIPYSELQLDGGSYLDLLRALGYRGFEQRRAHLDPDVVPSVRPRRDGWRGLAGQVGAAAAHLERQGVASGDLFLFFGRFQPVDAVPGSSYRWRGGESSVHALWGYLQVERVLDAGAGETVSWAPRFPHFAPRYRGRLCRVYVARERLSFAPALPGWGVFRWREELRLTARGRRRLTDWELPVGFAPETGLELTYHRSPQRWKDATSGRVALRAVSRGQEFVCEASADVRAWATALVETTRTWAPASGTR